MDRKPLPLLLAIVLMICGSSVSNTYAQGDAASTLKDLKGIYVDIVLLDSELEQQGLTQKMLKMSSERQIGKAGIGVLTKEEYHRVYRSPRYPMARLEISVVGEPQRTGPRIYAVTVQVTQQVILARKPVIKIWAPTWEIRKVISLESRAAVQQQIAEALDRFIMDFRSANSQ